MNLETKTKLDSYIKYLESAYYGDYIRQLDRASLEELIMIYKEVFGVPFTQKLTCGSCVLSLVKQLGREYFNWKEPEVKLEENLIKTKKGNNNGKSK